MIWNVNELNRESITNIVYVIVKQIYSLEIIQLKSLKSKIQYLESLFEL